MKAMILAAGLGTRLRPITTHFAKPAVPFLNVPLMYYPIFLAEEAGIDALVLNTHHFPEQIERLATAIPGANYPVAFSHEPGAPLGSGGGIRKARRYLEGGDFLVLNGDEVILPREAGVLARLRDEHRRHRSLATILVMRHPLVGTQFGGVWTDREGRVHGFGKDGSKFGSSLEGFHFIGAQLLSDRVFHYLSGEGDSNIFYDALTTAIAQGETVRVVIGDFTWFETGNARDFLHATDASLSQLANGIGKDAETLRAIAHRFWPQAERRHSLLQGMNTTLPRESLVDGTRLLTGNDCLVEPGAILKGFVVLGDRTIVRSGAIVENSVILPDTHIDHGHVIRGEIALPG